MKFYRVNGQVTDPTEQATEWATSKREAEKIANQMHYGDYRAVIHEVEIEPTKAGILAFLQKNIWTHRGCRAWLGE